MAPKVNVSGGVTSASNVDVVERTPAASTKGPAYASALKAVKEAYEHGDLASASPLARQLTCDFPERFSAWRMLAQVLTQKGELLQVIEIMGDCCNRFPELPDPWLDLARAHTVTGNADAANSSLDTAAALGASFAQCRAVELTTRQERHLVDPEVDALAIEVAEREKPLREVLCDQRHVEVQVVAGTPGAAVVIVFTGLADRASVPLEALDRMFAAHGLSAIYCRDFSRRMYIHGIGSLADDAAGTAAALRSMVDTLGATRVFTLGNSVGGHGAIHYALRLQARAALSYGGPTNAKADFLSSFDSRAGIVARRLNCDPVADELDLRPLILRSDGLVDLHLFYGAGMSEDRVHAEHVAGAPGVQLHADPECADHGVLSRHIADGKFAKLLKAVVAQEVLS